jgi:hypothetical protein
MKLLKLKLSINEMRRRQKLKGRGKIEKRKLRKIFSQFAKSLKSHNQLLESAMYKGIKAIKTVGMLLFKQLSAIDKVDEEMGVFE